MNRKSLFFLLLLQVSFGYAETIRTDVLVVGATASGIAAAMQSARSKVKTVLIESDGTLGGKLNPAGTYVVESNRNLSSGIWWEFRKRIREYTSKAARQDTSFNAALRFDGQTSAIVLKRMTDTIKNLTIKLHTTFSSIKKDGTGWEISILVNGKTEYIKAKIVVDATYKNIVVKKATNDEFRTILTVDNQQKLYITDLYRTGIAVGNYALEQNKIISPYTIPLASIVVKDQDNLLVTEKTGGTTADVPTNYLPIEMTIGQGAGATAAYCAFFKTTTRNLKVRTIQGELLDFKALIIPFEDVKPNDPASRAIQQVCATGLLKGFFMPQNNIEELHFGTDSTVKTAEIKPVLNEIYTRAFLWFNKQKPKEVFTVGNLLSFISDNTLTDPKVLQLNLQKAWKTQYKFASEFDMNRPVTRREFAVLANKFLNPFARTVDLSGRLIN